MLLSGLTINMHKSHLKISGVPIYACGPDDGEEFDPDGGGGGACLDLCDPSCDNYNDALCDKYTCTPESEYYDFTECENLNDDPCQEKDVLNNDYNSKTAVANGFSLNSTYDDLQAKLSASVEWGSVINAQLVDGSGVSAPPSYLYTNAINTNNSTQHYTCTLVWNPKTGKVSVGWTHTHTAGEGNQDCLSVDDVYTLSFFTSLYYQNTEKLHYKHF